MAVLALLGACKTPEPKAPAPPAAHNPQSPAGRSGSALDPAPPSAPPAAEAPQAPGEDDFSRLLEQIEAAYRGGDYERGLSLVKRVLELKRKDVSALDRVGSVYFILGRYGEALAIWQGALPAEQDPRRRRELQESIAVARRSLGLPAEAASRPPAKPPRPKPGRRRPDEKLIEELYQQGSRHYARGEYLQAMNVFLRILDLDPDNARAARALRRLNLREGAAAP